MLKNVNTAGKIIGLVVLMAVFMGAIGFTGYHFQKIANENLDSMFRDRLLPVQWLNEARVHARVIQLRATELMLTNLDGDTQQKYTAEIQERRAKVNSLITDYEKTKLDPYETERLPILRDNLAKYREGFDRDLKRAAGGEKQEAYADFQQNVEGYLENVNATLVELATYNAQVANEIKEQNTHAAAVANRIVLGILLIAVVLALAVGIFVARLIANPLQAILASVQEIAAGNLGQKPLQVDSRDEAGRLGAAINTMTANLQQLVQKVYESAEQVAAASEELTASAEQSAQASGQIAETITSVAGGAEKQLRTVIDAMSVVEHMAESVEQVAVGSMEATSAAEKAANAAQEGAESVDLAVGKMADIEKTVNHSAAVVTELGTRSQEIGQIVATISGIAGQTNLLALNAAIEAARAGEQGRGFAVVAEEVRKLAEQSQEAAKQIAELIGTIQSDTHKAVEAMSDGTREVKLGSEVVNAAGETFRHIVGIVQQVSGQMKESTAAIEQMADGSQQIVETVCAIDEISRSTSAGTQTVSAATQEQSATLQEIAASSAALARLAEQLQQAVRQFRV